MHREGSNIRLSGMTYSLHVQGGAQIVMIIMMGNGVGFGDLTWTVPQHMGKVSSSRIM